MSLAETVFAKDIVLDDEVFRNAANRFSKLATRIDTLQGTVSERLEALRVGFDTPAGHKFFEACGTKLLDPMKDQARVIQYVSDNLNMARTSYQSVFDEFKNLNSTINNL